MLSVYSSLQFAIPTFSKSYKHTNADLIKEMSAVPPSTVKYIVNGVFMPIIFVDMMHDLVNEQFKS